jgi:hypothetical protein
VTTKAEREYLSMAAALGCSLCRRLGYGATPAEIHHPRTGVGLGRRAPHTSGIPLCYEHHRGGQGLHGLGRKAFERTYQLTEQDLLNDTHQQLGIHHD